jgi:hypothetical protein
MSTEPIEYINIDPCVLVFRGRMPRCGCSLSEIRLLESVPCWCRMDLELY